MAINGVGAPRRKECVPRLCVQCQQMWTPQPHEHSCKRCGTCRETSHKPVWVHCENCDQGMALRPAAYWERYHANDWLCWYCKKLGERADARRKTYEKIPVPCGHIKPARSMTRCSGFNPTGDGDGCEHYEDCMDLAAKQLWDGFTATCGRRDVREWRYVDELWEFIRPDKHQQKAGRYGG